jgi:hypothetical protein
MTAFIVEFIFRKHGTEENEMENEGVNHIIHCKDDGWFSEELSEYMPLYQMAQETLAESPLGYWKVIMTGSICFNQDYYGEVDADYHIDSSNIYKIAGLEEGDTENDVITLT